MNDRVNTLDTSVGYGQTLPQAERQRVLRNTYWLLALSLLPTVLGAWLGVATGITRSLTGGLGPDRLPGRRLRLHVRHREDQELGGRRAGAAGLHLLHGPDAVAPDRDGAGLQERLRARS